MLCILSVCSCACVHRHEKKIEKLHMYYWLPIQLSFIHMYLRKYECFVSLALPVRLLFPSFPFVIRAFQFLCLLSFSEFSHARQHSVGLKFKIDLCEHDTNDVHYLVRLHRHFPNRRIDSSVAETDIELSTCKFATIMNPTNRNIHFFECKINTPFVRK